MKRQRYIGLLIAFIALVSFLAGMFLAPRLLAVLPSRIQARLPVSLHSVIYTPLPPTLPTPIVPVSIYSSQGVIPSANTPESLDINLVEPPTSDNSTSLTESRKIDDENSKPIATPTSGTGVALTTPPAASSIPDLKVVAQEFNNCGPANISIVLNYYGEESDQQVIGQQLKPNYEDRNVSPQELVDYVNNSTPLKAVSFYSGDMTVLKRILAAGYPVIIEKGLLLDQREGWMGHYLTLTGYNDEEQVFTSQDTFLGPWDHSGRLVSFAEVDEKWHQFNNIFILIFPADHEQEILSLLPNDFQDPSIMWQRAIERAQGQLLSDDSNAFTWFNLGSSLTHLGEITGDIDLFETAANAFDIARSLGLPWRMLWYQFEPYQAYLVAGRIDDVKLLTEAILIYEGGRNIEETYLYRGHALLASGDRDGAIRAYEKALTLNPSISAAQEALAFLN